MQQLWLEKLRLWWRRWLGGGAASRPPVVRGEHAGRSADSRPARAVSRWLDARVAALLEREAGVHRRLAQA